jgi:hypothetical protein
LVFCVWQSDDWMAKKRTRRLALFLCIADGKEPPEVGERATGTPV